MEVAAVGSGSYGEVELLLFLRASLSSFPRVFRSNFLQPLFDFTVNVFRSVKKVAEGLNPNVRSGQPFHFFLDGTVSRETAYNEESLDVFRRIISRTQ